MSLPPALLARLQKRGIVKQEDEVFAESYDADGGSKQFEENPAGAPGCPNKSNPFHVCVQYCYDHWDEGTPEYRLPERYLKQKARMLAKFPLPESWVEVYDAGHARYYYWNQDTDEVCWLSPKHPRALIGEAAPKICKKMFESICTFGPRSEYSSNREDSRDNGNRQRSRDDDRDKDRESRRPDKNRRRKRRDSDNEGENSEGGEDEEMNDRDRLKRARRKGIDPMDPAAYGDAPVGKWSAGLYADKNTGVDTTASGPLFQQRPYPAPGAILRKQRPPE
ncbi:unnamed protein product [Caenorhabditis auriculariae]|uniref:Polyglutamine-binding protein 1 n=1 Tax=Caenorhabditis auriculariae TaxID=2777116 RepID=A0A8S1H4R4_9PELO|nr:unnamed protein product [Caenorhabditis auriculariae]